MMNLINNQKSAKGFTLIELMIVVAIIGILAAIAIPQFSEYRKKAFNGAAMADLRNTMTSEEAYFSEEQAYISEAAIVGPKSAVSLPAVRISKNVTLLANATAASGTAPAKYAAITGHSEGSKNYAGDSLGNIQKKDAANPATGASGYTTSDLSAFAGTAL